MTDPRNLLDRQLSGMTWTQGDRRAVLCAIGKEKPVMKKKFATLLTAVLILALSFGFKKLRKHAKKTLERFYFGE